MGFYKNWPTELEWWFSKLNDRLHLMRAYIHSYGGVYTRVESKCISKKMNYNIRQMIYCHVYKVANLSLINHPSSRETTRETWVDAHIIEVVPSLSQKSFNSCSTCHIRSIAQDAHHLLSQKASFIMTSRRSTPDARSILPQFHDVFPSSYWWFAEVLPETALLYASRRVGLFILVRIIHVLHIIWWIMIHNWSSYEVNPLFSHIYKAICDVDDVLLLASKQTLACNSNCLVLPFLPSRCSSSRCVWPEDVVPRCVFAFLLCEAFLLL